MRLVSYSLLLAIVASIALLIGIDANPRGVDIYNHP